MQTTGLMQVSQSGYLLVMAYLIEKGADKNIQKIVSDHYEPLSAYKC